MKKLIMLTAGMALTMSAMAQTTFNCTADTWIRENNPSWKGGSSKTIEISGNNNFTDAEGNVTANNARFIGLMGFDFSVPSGMKVKSATLHLVTERYKGNPVSVYGYGNDFTEGDACWAVEENYINDATATAPAATFTPAGQKNKAIFDSGISDDRTNLEAWSNNIDITAYVKSLPATSRRVNLLLTQDGGQVCFFSKDNEGQEDAFKETSAQTSFNAAALIPYLLVTYTEDSDNSTDVILPTADTFVRSSAANQRYGHLDEMEIYQFTQDDGTLVTFAGLMNFPLPAEINMSGFELNGVQLRLVTTMLKGERLMEMYAYDYPMADEDKWEAVGPQVESTLSNEPILTFEVKGQGNKSLKADELSDDYKTAEAWTNYIDLTAYVKANLPMDNLSLMLNKPETSNRAIKFATREIEDVVNAKDASVTFAAADLRPQLVVSYSKANGENAVEVVIDLDAPAEYYNLNGVKVAHPDKGIYIVRQGNSVKKVVIK